LVVGGEQAGYAGVYFRFYGGIVHFLKIRKKYLEEGVENKHPFVKNGLGKNPLV
jgi:hypothetical protein